MRAQAKALSVPYPAALHRALFIATFAVGIWMLIVSPALAATPMGNVLCTIVFWIINGNLGRGIATLAIIVVGVGATLGKTSWGLALTVAVGISVVFGAPAILVALGVAGTC